MSHRWHDVRQLSDLLEAEAAGQPFDRTHARHLAHSLAERHPEIRQSLRLICDRFEAEGQVRL